MDSVIQNKKSVEKQYQTAENLNIRIAIHQRYSTNRQGFGSWIFEQYKFFEGSTILELGCGNGGIWKENLTKLPENCSLTLSDLSKDMLENAKRNLSGADFIDFQVIDIQSIPYPDNSFDIVIANMMLYHVPNLEKALQEVRRILKPDGVFYCATYGENGIIDILEQQFSDLIDYHKQDKVFTLQNGTEILQPFFSDIQCRWYEDALAVTRAEDLADYIVSVGNMSRLNQLAKDKIIQRLNEIKKDGVIQIPKEYGMFIARG